jgi:hypothetical protein
MIRKIAVVVLATCLVCVTRVGAAVRLTNAPPVNGAVVISWNSRGALETADQVTGPWVTKTNATNPYTNALTTGSKFFRLNQTVDATTLRKKVLCGYQGWFRCPGDGGSQWIHWSRSASTIASNTLTFEMWPDMSEYTNSYSAPGFTYPGGSQASLFSSQLAPGACTNNELTQATSHHFCGCVRKF